MKIVFKDIKLNIAADICGEGQGEAQLHLGEISVEVSSAEMANQIRELVNIVRDIERIRARRWKRDEEE